MRLRSDAITAEVIRGALTYAAEEMGIVLRNSSYSPNIKERMDHSCTIFDDRYRLVAQAEHIPLHLGSMTWAVQQGLKHFGSRLEDGDMLVYNDPYISGTHLPDLTTVYPVFYKSELVGYTANKAHHVDVGGKTPGSMAADSTELYQEGLIIPPTKIMERGRLNDDVLGLILRNVRTPKTSMGDLKAQIAANIIGRRRVLEVIDGHGFKVYRNALTRIMDYSESMLRRRLREIPSGKYSATDYLENSGVLDRPIKLEVNIEVDGDEVNVDYTGTDKQVMGPVNAVWGVTLSGVFYVIKCITDPEIPMNDGCFRPVRAHAPEGIVLNPVPPAPVAGGNVETSQRNVDVLLKAFSQAVPDKICAACQGTMNNIAMGGIDPRSGLLWSFYETNGGGFGGRVGLDGENGIHSHLTNTMNTPVESIEATYPLKVLRYSLRPDSAGAGLWRGGAGLERHLMLCAPSASVSILAERNEIAPWGLKGGKEGGLGEYIIRKRDGSVIRLRSKSMARMEEGDTLIVRTPGGGGYGNPYERDPIPVLEDVRAGLLSIERAKIDYGVAIDPATMLIDVKATQELRRNAWLHDVT